jgi:hypothetical protein
MRLSFGLLLAFSSPTKDVVAFSSKNHFARSRTGNPLVTSRSTLPSTRSSSITSIQSALREDNDDCGCALTIYSGKPSDVARVSNPRQAIRTAGSILNLDSEEVRMDDLLENKNGESPVSIVVFLRSLG